MLRIMRPFMGECRARISLSATACMGERLTLRNQENGIRTIVLNDVRTRNALSLAMLESLREDLTFQCDSPDLRVIILAANGPVFCAGHDLKELRPECGRDFHVKVFKTCSEVIQLLSQLPVPIVAKVQGLATAAGCQLVASCDMALASETARFATPGLRVGLFCSTPGVALARSVPRKVALEMLLTGEPISADDALRHGLVSRVVPLEQLNSAVENVARRVCEASREVVSLEKRQPVWSGCSGTNGFPVRTM
uniref:enoyl-CoA hydratase domain-containing protein 3, mitochondrial isoform X5 n=1 Tax=Myxine glutinosa TaxID=7769 RepID=UPI0035900BBB